LIIIDTNALKNTNRQIHCPNGGFISTRIILASHNMGYTLTKTVIPKGDWQHWHYKKHLESCHCLSGIGILHDIKTNKKYNIYPDITYVLDKNDDHNFKAIEDVILLCVFNPPLKGNEVHLKDGSYSIIGVNNE